MSFLRKIKSKLEKENPFVSIVDEGILSDVDEYTSTGSYMLNALISGSLYGGVPNKKITVFAGETTVGKTYLCLSIVKNFLDENEDGECVIMESEGALTKQMFIQREIDPSRVMIVPVQTVQDFRKTTLQILDEYIAENSGRKLLLILDSLGNLSTTKEMEDSLAGKETQDMTRSRLIKSAFRTITLKLAVANVPMIVTNHVYDEQGMFPKKVMSGGSGIHYNASVTVFFSKRKEKDTTGDVVGNILTAKVVKSRITKENSSGELYLGYNTGLNPYYGLLDLAEKYELVKKVGNKYTFPSGKSAFEKTIYKNPEEFFTKEFMDKLEECARKEYSFEDTDGLLFDEDESDDE
ncbi:MAG: recombinase RecA [Patescibacteria group bacterium]|nr:recombinase RecA [Patescibacteria group bacterium]